MERDSKKRPPGFRRGFITAAVLVVAIFASVGPTQAAFQWGDLFYRLFGTPRAVLIQEGLAKSAHHAAEGAVFRTYTDLGVLEGNIVGFGSDIDRSRSLTLPADFSTADIVRLENIVFSIERPSFEDITFKHRELEPLILFLAGDATAPHPMMPPSEMLKIITNASSWARRGIEQVREDRLAFAELVGSPIFRNPGGAKVGELMDALQGPIPARTIDGIPVVPGGRGRVPPDPYSWWIRREQ